MQLFIIDKDPFVAASYLAGCHVRKQILKSVVYVKDNKENCY